MILRITKTDLPAIEYVLALRGIAYDVLTDERSEGLAFLQIEGCDHLLFYIGREVQLKKTEMEDDAAANDSLFNLFKVNV